MSQMLTLLLVSDTELPLGGPRSEKGLPAGRGVIYPGAALHGEAESL